MDLAVLRIMMIIFESFNISPLLLSLLEKKTLQQNQREAVGVLCQMFITALLCWLMISLAGVVIQFLANLRALWVWIGLFFVFWPCRGFFFHTTFQVYVINSERKYNLHFICNLSLLKSPVFLVRWLSEKSIICMRLWMWSVFTKGQRKQLTLVHSFINPTIQMN